jgi:saccharopine dehydrogenase (NADP+, L-glutamate forming)
MSHAQFVDAFLPPLPDSDDVEERTCKHFGLKPESPEIKMLRWSGFFDNTPVGLMQGSPAKILEFILNKKWALRDGDKDQIVMWHRFRYQMEGKGKEIQASLVATGFDAVYTAMSKTVGLPLGIATKLISQNKVTARGVVIPTTAEFYNPILQELSTLGITLHELEVR